MATHASEVIVWSLAYAIVGAAPASADPVYFAFVNYTTLGYGDVTPVERWRLLRIELLKRCLDAGLSCRQTAREIGVTRNGNRASFLCTKAPLRRVPGELSDHQVNLFQQPTRI
jgi:Ion channel